MKMSNNLSRKFNMTLLKLKKHSPEIMIVGGVIGLVAGGVMACHATTKAQKVLQETKKNIETIHECANNPELAEQYTQEDVKKDLTIVYAQTGLKLVKLYAPAVILGALSATSILASNNIMRKRNLALAAGWAAADQSLKEYKGRVVERFGEAVDRELTYGIKAKQVEEVVVDEKTGKEKKVKKNVEVVENDSHLASPYAKFFDESSEYWEKDADLNLMFLRSEQNWANDKLRSRGYLFLNEVYEHIGINPTQIGQRAGWIYAPDIDDHEGDNYVDFGIYDINRPNSRDFVNGIERVILLDFNVDGDIYSLMNDPEYCGKFCR